jgi:hypothetical protein
LPLLAQIDPVLPQFPPAPATFERLLLPVFTEPVHGAFGSEFHTTLHMASKAPGSTVRVYGLEPVCILGAPCPTWRLFEYWLGIESEGTPFVYQRGTPGQFLFVPKEDLPNFTANLRVHDVTRASQNYGTEMPIVRSSAFRNRIILTGVPTDPRFRNTLRIYGEATFDVTVTVEGREPVTMKLGGAANLFDPGYAIFSNFPVGAAPVTVTIEAVHTPVPMPFSTAIWAFITVTNNDTQVISTITPQP